MTRYGSGQEPPRIGLTGGIGCGKTTVAGLFGERGAGIIDTDAISHCLTRAGGKAIDMILSTFGNAYITPEGAMDRTKMRIAVFSDSSAKRQLEAILHPLILEQTIEQLREMRDKPYLIIVVPLLPNVPSFLRLVQRVLVVDCSEQEQIARVMTRTGMTVSEVQAIIAHQTPRAALLNLANDIIENDEGIDKLSNQVNRLHHQYLALRNRI